MSGSQQKGKIFTDVIFTNYPKDGKNVQQAMEHALKKALFITLPNCVFPLEKNSLLIIAHLTDYSRERFIVLGWR